MQPFSISSPAAWCSRPADQPQQHIAGFISKESTMIVEHWASQPADQQRCLMQLTADQLHHVWKLMKRQHFGVTQNVRGSVGA